MNRSGQSPAPLDGVHEGLRRLGEGRAALKGTVLLVEDERDTRELLSQAIERAGWCCVAAADPRER